MCIAAFSLLFPSLPLFIYIFVMVVSTQRKPEEESPVKDTEAKQAKQEATVNGSGDSSASNGNGVQEEKSQEASPYKEITSRVDQSHLNLFSSLGNCRNGWKLRSHFCNVVLKSVWVHMMKPIYDGLYLGPSGW